MHDVEREAVAEGLAQIDRGSGLIARLIAAVVGFPRAGHDVPLRVRFVADGRGELWERTFAGRRFASYQFPAERSLEPIVFERFGPITIALRLNLDGSHLDIVPQRWSLLGVPLPQSLMPVGETFETVDEQGRFNFHVEIGHPSFGRIVRYRGYLVPRP